MFDPTVSATSNHLRDLIQSSGPLGVSELSQVLARGYGETVSVLGSLRASRNLLERTTVDSLDYASSVLTEMETRLAGLASILDPTALGTAHPERVKP